MPFIGSAARTAALCVFMGNQELRKVVVLGGGISGLAVAWMLSRDTHYRVRVFEAGPRAGGMVGSERAEGFVVEAGPMGFLDTRQDLLDLCEQLGLRDRLEAADPAAKNRYIVWKNKLQPIPSNPLQLFGTALLTPLGKLRLLAERFVPAGRNTENENLYEFGKRRFGVQAAETLFDVMAKGVFGGDPKALGVTSAFPRLLQLERQHGSLIKGMMAKRKAGGLLGRLLTPREGMSAITDTLSSRLGERLRLNTEVVAIRAAQSGYRVIVQNESGEREETAADVVVSALPPGVLGRLGGVQGTALGDALRGTPHAPIASVSLGFERSLIGHALDGFGLLCPTREKQPFMGVLWSSSVFPHRAPQGKVLVRAMVGGAQSPATMQLGDDEMETRVIAGLKSLIGLKGGPCFRRVHRWSPGLPQYGVEHHCWMQRVETLQSSFPGLFITGNGYRGVGVGDCVADAVRVTGRAQAYFREI